MPPLSSKPPRTARLGSDVIQTRIVGRITLSTVGSLCEDFERLRGARFWLWDSMSATGYDPDAIDPCVFRVQTLAKQRMFETIVVATSDSFAKLYASLIKLARVELEIVDTLDEAEEYMAERRDAYSWRRSGAWRL